MNTLKLIEIVDRTDKDFALALVPAETLKKFAESIVRECAEIAKHHVMNISTYADAEFVEDQIKQYFGIEK